MQNPKWRPYRTRDNGNKSCPDTIRLLKIQFSSTPKFPTNYIMNLQSKKCSLFTQLSEINFTLMGCRIRDFDFDYGWNNALRQRSSLLGFVFPRGIGFVQIKFSKAKPRNRPILIRKKTKVAQLSGSHVPKAWKKSFWIFLKKSIANQPQKNLLWKINYKVGRKSRTLE